MRHFLLVLYLSLSFLMTLKAQQKPQKKYLNPDIIQGTHVKRTGPMRDFVAPPFDGVIVKGEKLGYHPKGDWILNDSINPNAKPNGMDPALQLDYAPPRGPQKALNQQYDGMGYTSVHPPDPDIDISPTHVIQMINGSGGSYYIIYDRLTGAEVVSQTYFDSFTGIGGLGDPIVLYDQLADRWLMSEFSNSGNLLVVAISVTNDPTGTWDVYSYAAPEFPDYPKYAVWTNAYVVTSNESSPAVYALDRTAMLAGTAGTMQRFTVPPYGTIGFQAMTPADIDGTTLPPAGEPAIVMRMADDAWDPNLNQDQLEIFEFDIDFATPANTSITLTQVIATLPFDTHLCGYTSFSCIDQQGSSTNLDPLRELLMNKIHYRRFPTYEAMVMCHVTDVTGNDDAGVRWYELRRTTGNWVIHQQGTYSPDTESRWMASIAINGDGSIGLAYNTSSSSSYPSIKYTGRMECDPLGTMTEPETVMGEGLGPNGSNRYGDYASMAVDPVDGSFWFTGEYNPNASGGNWSTRIGNFDIGNCGPAIPTISFTANAETVNESDANIISTCLDYVELGVTISLSEAATMDPTVTLTLGGDAIQGIDFDAPAVLNATLTSSNLTQTFVFNIYNDAIVEANEDLIIGYTLNANGGDAVAGTTNQTFTAEIVSDDNSPVGGAMSIVVLSEDFESNTLGSFTTNNQSGDTPFQTGNEATAESGPFDVPPPLTGTFMAYVNDDACNCNQDQVNLISPVFDLSNATSAELVFDYYYEDNLFGGYQEDADVFVSINGGTSYTPLLDLSDSGLNTWDTETIDLTSYVGNSNVIVLFRYSDGTGWLYGLTIDNVVVNAVVEVSSVQVIVNSSMPAEEYLGPNSTVHFYDPTSNSIMMTITNSSSHDFGCTTVEVDRSGDPATALVFSTNEIGEYVASKTFKITPDNPSSTANYNIDLYYQENEIAGWETTTGASRNDLSIVKVAGNNSIGDVTPANASSFTITYYSTALGAFDTDVIVSATIPNGFSGFGIGIDPGSESGCGSFVANTWIGPSTGDWHASPANWSLNELPTVCHDVVIPTGNNITVSGTNEGLGHTLDVTSGSTLTVGLNALLTITAPF